MPIAQIHHETRDNLYFLTPTIKNWYYVFDRYNRWQILADSLQYCQKNKGLEVFAYVFMLNHIHMIVRCDDVAGFIRDFKRHTATKLKASLAKYEPRILPLFINEDATCQLWKKDNQPKIIETEKFFLQKLNYIHQNPVRKYYVERPEYWKWSSANPNSEIKTVAF